MWRKYRTVHAVILGVISLQPSTLPKSEPPVLARSDPDWDQVTSDRASSSRRRRQCLEALRSILDVIAAVGGPVLRNNASGLSTGSSTPHHHPRRRRVDGQAELVESVFLRFEPELDVDALDVAGIRRVAQELV